MDLGCGNGRLIDFLKEKDYFNSLNYIGIDPSIELINICKNRYTANNIFKKIKSLFYKNKEKNIDIINNIKFKINDGISVPLNDNSLDIVISLAVLHHIPIEYQDIWLSEIYRVIKKDKNSKIILTVWIQDQKSYIEDRTVHKKISDKEIVMGFAQYENIRYLYLFTEDELINLLIKNKFKVLGKHIDKRPNSDQKNLILILEPEI